ncbi:MAG: permease [Gammaproteobacteria bacterium]
MKHKTTDAVAKAAAAPTPVPSCHGSRPKKDLLLWGSLFLVTFLYLLHWQFPRQANSTEFVSTLAQSTFELMNTMWWGVAIGILMISLLCKIPREFVVCLLGTGTGLRGMLRATLGGVLLDLCSHGILMVGAKLYERGVSTGQVMAFLIASPWNSFSLTLVLIALIGIKWTLAFIIASMGIAIVTGLIFEQLTKTGRLPANPHQIELPKGFKFRAEAVAALKETNFTGTFILNMLRDGIVESRMVVRWLLFGVLLASLIRASVDVSIYSTYFGPTALGLALTVFAATVIEVCSEGSAPIAADLLTRANAPGNSFAFLMAGVSTDYTEIMVLKDATRSWKIALFLPLISAPQIIFVAWLMN